MLPQVHTCLTALPGCCFHSSLCSFRCVCRAAQQQAAPLYSPPG